MAKPRIYGQSARRNLALYRGVRNQNKRAYTFHEITTPKPVAGQIAKKKEGEK